MSSTTSVKSRVALFESQTTENENIKQKPRPTDQSVAKVQKQVFSAASPPDTSPPLKGRFFSENQSGLTGLKELKYSSKQVQSYLESQGVFQKVEQGTVQLAPYVEGIKRQGNIDYNEQVLADLKGQYGSIPLNKALGDLGIDRHVFDSGEGYLTAEQINKIEEVCKNAARFQIWLTPLEAAFGREAVQASSNFKDKHLQGVKGISDAKLEEVQSLVIEQNTGPVFEKAQAHIESGNFQGLLQMKEQLVALSNLALPSEDKRIAMRALEMVQSVEKLMGTPDQIFNEISQTYDSAYGEGTCAFFAFYGWRVDLFIDSPEALCQAFLKGECQTLLTSEGEIESKFKPLIDSVSKESEAKIIEEGGRRQSYFEWMGTNKQYNVVQYDQTKDSGALEHTSYGTEKRHYVCQSLVMQQARVLSEHPSRSLHSLQLKSDDETIAINKEIRRNRFDSRAFTRLGFQAPSSTYDEVKFETNAEQSKKVAQKLQVLEKMLEPHGLALINLDPSSGSTDMPHSFLVQIIPEEGIYRFIDAGVGSFDFKGDRKAFYKAVTELAATVYYTTPKVSMVALRKS